MNGLTFRVATETDVPFLLELRRQTMTEHPARRLYERLGFRIVGENEHAYDMQYGRGSRG